MLKAGNLNKTQTHAGIPRLVFTLGLIALVLTGLPLAVAWLSGQDIQPHLGLPHPVSPIEHAPFSWPVWIGMGVPVFIMIVVYVLLIRNGIKKNNFSKTRAVNTFPWWGKIGVLVILVFWILAWNRFEWFSEYQVHTFTPLWLGYILIMNALTWSRTGTCLLTAHPRYLAALFLLSALFWWYYEYLNTFIRNWHYVGTDSLGRVELVIHSSLAYATVLPAVICTLHYFLGFSLLKNSFRGIGTLNLNNARALAWTALFAGCAMLVTSTRYPEVFFPLVWISPLFIIAGLQQLVQGHSILSPVAHGDWTPVLMPPLAALCCGFFWELWNVKSLAHWEYSIPYVQAFHIFEMPAIGYAGYLPFGVVCLSVAWLLPGTGRRLEMQT
ncbi:MAG: hypothetical protein R3318_04025 [Gammaproteobacteria bacterium]|nr:hypothetical protein [Gammaproteobacteria bacterium]